MSPTEQGKDSGDDLERAQLRGLAREALRRFAAATTVCERFRGELTTLHLPNVLRNVATEDLSSCFRLLPPNPRPPRFRRRNWERACALDVRVYRAQRRHEITLTRSWVANPVKAQ